MTIPASGGTNIPFRSRAHDSKSKGCRGKLYVGVTRVAPFGPIAKN